MEMIELNHVHKQLMKNSCQKLRCPNQSHNCCLMKITNKFTLRTNQKLTQYRKSVFRVVLNTE